MNDHDFTASATFDSSEGRYCIHCGKLRADHAGWVVINIQAWETGDVLIGKAHMARADAERECEREADALKVIFGEDYDREVYRVGRVTPTKRLDR